MQGDGGRTGVGAEEENPIRAVDAVAVASFKVQARGSEVDITALDPKCAVSACATAPEDVEMDRRVESLIAAKNVEKSALSDKILFYPRVVNNVGTSEQVQLLIVGHGDGISARSGREGYAREIDWSRDRDRSRVGSSEGCGISCRIGHTAGRPVAWITPIIVGWILQPGGAAGEARAGCEPPKESGKEKGGAQAKI